MAESYAARQMSDREGDCVMRCMREFGELVAQRALFAGQWEEAALLLLPTSRNTFQFGSFNWQGQKKTDRQVDMSGGLALSRFCAIADSLCTPRNMTYDGLAADGPDADKLMSVREVRLYFEQITKILFSYRYAQIGNFAGQNYNNWQSIGGFGNATMFVDKFDSRMLPGTKGLRYRSVPLGETFFGENHQGMVDRIHRWFRLTPYQCLQKFGKEWMPQNIQAALSKDSQYPFDFLHVVRPRDEDDYDPDRIDERGKPFASYYISIDGRCMMAPEGGYRKFPYSVSRYDQTPGEVYGRGPAQIALPALKTLNAMKTTFLKQAHRASDPVLLTSDEGMTSVSLRPGALNVGGMSPDGKRLIDILPTGNIQIAKEMMLEERGLIDDVFLVSLFKVLSEHPSMTATQVIELVNEKGMLVAPTLGRQFGDRSAMVEREIDLLAEQGLLPPMPNVLKEAGAPYRVVDNSPLALAARAGQAAGFFRTLENVKEVVAITQDPSPLDEFNFGTAIPDISRIQNVPEKWMNDDKTKAALRQNRAKAAARKQQTDALPSQAAIMKAQAAQFKAGMGQQGQQQGQPQQQQQPMVAA
jgi:hypothetical protein